MTTLVKQISKKLVEFGLNNINEDTTVTVDIETKEVEVFDTNKNSFIGKESFCANQFIYYNDDYQVQDVNLDEIKNQTCIIE